VPFEEYVFPDEIHGFLMHKSWVKAYELTSDFFGRKLGTTAK
jgi:dipeptidyl aminopeptidase/acylaminoacyl peptidase